MIIHLWKFKLPWNQGCFQNVQKLFFEIKVWFQDWLEIKVKIMSWLENCGVWRTYSRCPCQPRFHDHVRVDIYCGKINLCLVFFVYRPGRNYERTENELERGGTKALYYQHPQGFIPIYTLAMRNFIQPCNLTTIHWASVSRLDGTCVIMDDLLVGGSSNEEHMRRSLAGGLSYHNACL